MKTISGPTTETPKTSLKWSGTDPYEIDTPLRNLLREELPDVGIVIVDIDLHVRSWSPSNMTGEFRLLEFKHGSTDLINGQVHGYRQMDRLLRAGDPDRKEYLGFYRVNYSDYEWRHDMSITVTKLFEKIETRAYDRAEFIEFLNHTV